MAPTPIGDINGIVGARALAAHLNLTGVAERLRADENTVQEKFRWIEAGFQIVNPEDMGRLFRRKIRLRGFRIQVSQTGQAPGRIWAHPIPRSVMDRMMVARQLRVKEFAIFFPGWPAHGNGYVEFAGDRRIVMGAAPYGIVVKVGEWNGDVS